MGPSDGEAAFQLALQGRAIEAQAKCRRIRKSDPDNPYLLVIEGLAQANQAGVTLQAWKAGDETIALHKQLAAMQDGGDRKSTRLNSSH